MLGKVAAISEVRITSWDHVLLTMLGNPTGWDAGFPHTHRSEKAAQASNCQVPNDSCRPSPEVVKMTRF